MRSGSTLLKALLGSAPDVAHLPEVNFQKVLPSAKLREEMESEYPEGILLLKRPAWFNETRSYPRIDENHPVRRIILLRDVYETVRSVGRMIGGKRFDRFPGLWGHRLLAKHYWAPVTRNLLRQARTHSNESILIFYESLLTDPENETLRILKFIGSTQEKGFRSYTSPENAKWKWGSDDGSPRIRTREVQPPRELSPRDRQHRDTLCADPVIREIRENAGWASGKLP